MVSDQQSSRKAIAMIPVRIGSQRLPKKNLVVIRGRPLMSYAIEAALKSDSFSRVVVNGDDPVFEPIALSSGAEFYHRPPQLGGSDVHTDEVVADFLSKHVIAWVNTTTPLLTSDEIRTVVNEFNRRSLDSLITAERRFSHAQLDGAPVNFVRDEPFAKTQDLIPVDLFNYAVMIWRSQVFKTAYHEDGHALFCGKFGTTPISKASGLMVKFAEDIELIEAMLSLRHAGPQAVSIKHVGE